MRARIHFGELGEVDHVRGDVDEGEDDRPGDRFVESNVLVERDGVVERCASEEGDEVAADGEEDEGQVDD